MRRSKEDANDTRNRILKSATEIFLKKGYTRSTLDEIAKHADVTKGAVYWHFANKQNLFEAILTMILNNAGILNFANKLPENMTYEQRMYEVFWNAQKKDSSVDNLYSIMNLVEYEPELHKYRHLITAYKEKLFGFFKDETRIHMRICSIEGDSLPYARQLFLIYEGLFLARSINTGDMTNRDVVESCVLMAIKDIL